jgi:hypothetical protein
MRPVTPGRLPNCEEDADMDVDVDPGFPDVLIELGENDLVLGCVSVRSISVHEIHTSQRLWKGFPQDSTD